MLDIPHRFTGFVEKSILEVLLQSARFPLAHFSEKSLQVRLSAKLLANEELATPVPTDIQHRYMRNLELICKERRTTDSDLKTFLDHVYRVPPLQMEYGRGDKRRIDIAILDPIAIRSVCNPISFQLAERAYVTPVIGVEFGTEKTGWHKMSAHLTNDASKLRDCTHGYSVSVMRNVNFGRESLKGFAAKDRTVSVFRTSMHEHAVRHPRIKWIGVILNLAFGNAECYTHSGEWITSDISSGLSGLESSLRTILTSAKDVS